MDDEIRLSELYYSSGKCTFRALNLILVFLFKLFQDCGDLMGCLKERAPCFPKFSLLGRFSETLLVVSILDAQSMIVIFSRFCSPAAVKCIKIYLRYTTLLAPFLCITFSCFWYLPNVEVAFNYLSFIKYALDLKSLWMY